MISERNSTTKFRGSGLSERGPRRVFITIAARRQNTILFRRLRRAIEKWVKQLEFDVYLCHCSRYATGLAEGGASARQARPERNRAYREPVAAASFPSTLSLAKMRALPKSTLPVPSTGMESTR